MPEYETLYASVGHRAFLVTSWKQVSAAYVRFAQTMRARGTQPPECHITDARGRVRACVSPTGRVWQGDGDRVTGVCFYDPRIA